MRRQPAHFTVLDELGHSSLKQARCIDLQHRNATVAKGNVGTDPVTDMDGDAQLLIAFPDQGLDFRLTRLDFTARKLPPTCEFGRFEAGAREHSATGDDGGSDNHAGHRPFGLHEASECQIITEMYALPSLWLPDVGYVGSRQSVLTSKH